MSREKTRVESLLEHLWSWCDQQSSRIDVDRENNRADKEAASSIFFTGKQELLQSFVSELATLEDIYTKKDDDENDESDESDI